MELKQETKLLESINRPLTLWDLKKMLRMGIINGWEFSYMEEQITERRRKESYLRTHTEEYVAKREADRRAQKIKQKVIYQTRRRARLAQMRQKLPADAEAVIIEDTLTVVCKFCGTRFAITDNQYTNRMAAFEGKLSLGTQNNFYCSEVCKSACPIYKDKSSVIPKPLKQKARQCQTKTLKQLQCDQNNGQSYCEKCGDFIDVDLHHTIPVSQDPINAINPAGHILLCTGCHTELHRSC